MKRTLIAFVLILALAAMASCSKGGSSLFNNGGLGEKDDGEHFSFTTKDVYGNAVSSKELFSENKITMINVWASWCGPCVGELGELQALSETLNEMGCGLIGILDDGDEAGGLRDGLALMDSNGITYPVVVSNAGIRSQLNLQYYPTTVFVDASGRMIGEPIIGAQVDAYLPAIQSLLADMD